MDVHALNIEKESSDKKFLDKAMQIVKENYKNSYYEISDFIEAMGVSKSLMNKNDRLQCVCIRRLHWVQ